jgi:hypothetical protein
MAGSTCHCVERSDEAIPSPGGTSLLRRCAPRNDGYISDLDEIAQRSTTVVSYRQIDPE